MRLKARRRRAIGQNDVAQPILQRSQLQRLVLVQPHVEQLLGALRAVPSFHLHRRRREGRGQRGCRPNSPLDQPCCCAAAAGKVAAMPPQKQAGRGGRQCQQQRERVVSMPLKEMHTSTGLHCCEVRMASNPNGSSTLCCCLTRVAATTSFPARRQAATATKGRPNGPLLPRRKRQRIEGASGPSLHVEEQAGMQPWYESTAGLLSRLLPLDGSGGRRFLAAISRSAHLQVV